MRESTSLPPGPREPALVQAIRFGQSPYDYLSECAREIGDPFTLRLPGDPPRVVFSDPALVQQTFALRADDYQQADQAFVLNIGENALLFLDGERHRRERVVMTPPLHGERLRGYMAIMSETVKAAISTWKPGDHVEIHPFLQRVTLDILLRCVFGFAEAERLRAPTSEWMTTTLTPALFFAGMAFGTSRVRHWLDDLVRRSGRDPGEPRGLLSRALRGAESIAFSKIPVARGARAKGELMRALRSDVEACRAAPDGRTDVLALLAASRYEDGAPMEVDHIIDELVVLILGGHETTANTLAWALGHMLPRRAILDRCHEEIARAFDGGPVDPAATDRLAYVEACIKEAMRLTPIAPAIPRTLARPMKLGAYDLAPGTIVWPSVYLTHHRPDLWPEPHAYEPSRFVDAPSPSKNNFFPFGGGRRACLGMAFATVEMRIILAELLSRVDLALAPRSRPEAVFRGMTIAPAEGLTMVVERLRDLTPPRAARGQGEAAP